MKTYLVQLDDHDDILSARDKISWSKAQRVLVVWPRRGRVLERRVDLLLMLRHSQQIGAQMAIVTRSGEVIANARDLGIPVFASVVKAQQAAWRRPKALRKNLSVDRQPPDPQDLRDRRLDLARNTAASLPSLAAWQARAAVFTAGVLAFLALVLFFVPGARVTVVPQRTRQEVRIPVRASPSIAAPSLSGGLPAGVLRVVVEGRETAPATGRVLVPDRFAAGEVVLTNLTDRAVDIPAGAVVLSTGEQPVRLAITRAVRVAAGPGQSVTAPVRALQAGRAGNLAAGQVRAMEGSDGLRVRVDNPEPIRGGSESTAPAPTSADYRKLRETLLATLQANALDEIRAKAEEGQILLPVSLRQREVIEENQEPPAGAPADRLQLTLQAEYEAWYVLDADLRAVAQAALEANVAPGFRPVSGTLAYTFLEDPEWDTAAGEGSLRWTVQAGRQVEAEWSEALVIASLRGKRADEAQRYLQSSLALSAAPVVQVFPAWWGTMPFLPSRIEVVQQ